MLKLRMKILRIFIKSKLGNEINYINGPEVLPPPLSAEEEHDIIEKYAMGDDSVKEELIVHNLRLVVYIAAEV